MDMLGEKLAEMRMVRAATTLAVAAVPLGLAKVAEELVGKTTVTIPLFQQ
jgi:hypothetical protein